MRNLTERQKEVLDFIIKFTDSNGFPPTVREIGDNFGISLRAVQDHITACQKKGFLSFAQKRSRSIRALKDSNQIDLHPYIAKVPVISRYVPGKSAVCNENIDAYLNLTEPIVKKDKMYFAITVKGADMNDAGIFDGDTVIAELSENVSDGQIVVAVVDNSFTIRKFYREGDRIRLQPENPDFQPIYTNDTIIAGVMVSLIRSY